MHYKAVDSKASLVNLFWDQFLFLWQVRGMQLRGLRYSPLSFAAVNVGLMGLITLIYVVLTEGIMALVTDFFG